MAGRPREPGRTRDAPVAGDPQARQERDGLAPAGGKRLGNDVLVAEFAAAVFVHGLRDEFQHG